MSKIYEALLRAEREREANGSASAPIGLAEPPADPALEAPAAHSLVIAASLAAQVASQVPSEPFGQTPADQPFITTFAAPPAGPQRPVINQASYIDFDPSQVTLRPWDPMLNRLPALDERGKAVEQFRSLRSRMFEFRDLNKLKSIIVSSGLPKEGKSFITVNLAISFAMHLGNRVLLIDGDMRRSTLHKLLGAPGEIGLSEYLSGEASLMDILQRGTASEGAGRLPGGLASLTFIAAGAESDKAADLSGNMRFDELIAKVSPHFDWIVVDSSPVNLVADGVNLARACDGVLLVARGGVTRFQSAQRALTELKACNLLGVVLNAVAEPSSAGGYYGYEEYDAEIREAKEAELTAK